MSRLTTVALSIIYLSREFAICLGSDSWKYYEDYPHSPDTAGGMITQGSVTTNGKHNFLVGETGYYDIYVNGEGVVYIVHETQGGGGGGGQQTATWPSDYIEDALYDWGVSNDVVPECGTD